MRPILLARHGETAWNALDRLQGHTDIALNDTGRGQARALAAALREAGLAAVWTSDLARSRETGEIIASALGLAAPWVEPELRERRSGIFEGLTRRDCQVLYPDAWQAWLGRTGAPPGGESGVEATTRFGRALARIAATEGGPALVVAHGEVMRLWLADVLGTSIPPIANGATYAVEHGAALRAELVVAPRRGGGEPDPPDHRQARGRASP